MERVDHWKIFNMGDLSKMLKNRKEQIDQFSTRNVTYQVNLLNGTLITAMFVFFIEFRD